MRRILLKCTRRINEVVMVDDFESLDRYLKEMHFLVNDFDNAIYEIDLYDPSTFFHVVRVLKPIIEKEV